MLRAGEKPTTFPTKAGLRNAAKLMTARQISFALLAKTIPSSKPEQSIAGVLGWMVAIFAKHAAPESTFSMPDSGHCPKLISTNWRARGRLFTGRASIEGWAYLKELSASYSFSENGWSHRQTVEISNCMTTNRKDLEVWKRRLYSDYENSNKNDRHALYIN